MQQTSNKLRTDIHIDSSIFALYVKQKKYHFPNSDFIHSDIKHTHTNKLAEFKEMGSCEKDYWRCAFLYIRFVNVPT